MNKDNNILNKPSNEALNCKASLSPNIAFKRLEEQPLALNDRNRQFIEDVATQTGETPRQVLNRLIGELEENHLFGEMKRCYSELRQDEAAWQKELDEREDWRKLMDDSNSESPDTSSAES